MSAELEPKRLHLETTVHGRVLLQASTSVSSAGRLLMVFHGYAQSAEDGLSAVRGIPGLEAWNVASVQALHPFYRGRTEQVVASWMTRQDRELAIADNLHYVSTAVRTLEDRLGFSDPTRVYCGFSQGAAMAWRAAAMLDLSCDGLIILGGDVPPELADLSLETLPPVLIGRGRGERAYSRDQMERDLALLTGKDVTFSVCEYDGGHEWTNEFRDRCGSYLASMANRRE